MDFKILKSTTEKKQGLEICGVSSPSSYHRRSCAPAAAPVVVAAVATAVAVIDMLSGLGLVGVFVVCVWSLPVVVMVIKVIVVANTKLSKE